MKEIARLIWTEPAIATGVPTVILAAAAGTWDNPALAFAAAAMAAVGALFTRMARSTANVLKPMAAPPAE